MSSPSRTDDDRQQALEDRIALLEERTHMLELIQRKRSANLLLLGSIFGFFGFLFAFIIGIITEQTHGHIDYRGVPFKSGRGYFPATVSEMVADPAQPAGKCFFAFCFIGAFMIFFSWYPVYLANCYIGDDAVTVFFGISWTHVRQYTPPLGMMLLSVITVVPWAKATLTDEFVIGLHLFGAGMLFVGYCLCEAHTLGWVCCRQGLNLPRRERRVRKAVLLGIAVFYAMFCACQLILIVGQPFYHPEDADVWGPVPDHHGITKIELLDSATWKVKIYKVLSYSCECVCGILLIGSHIVIWYYSSERAIDLPEKHFSQFNNEYIRDKSSDSSSDSG